MRLKGKIALVTGSSSGIGAGIAKGMAAEGADVIVNYRSNSVGAEKTAKAITKMGRKTLIVRADVGLSNDADNLFDQIKRNFGKLDILVNNAGITIKKPFEQTPENDWDRMMDTNLKSIFLCCKRAVPIIPAGGAILNISSIHAWINTYNFSSYAATKGGMEALTRSLAVEFGEKKIRVNALRVGLVNVERDSYDASCPGYEATCARTPVGRVGEIEDVVGPAIHLCADESAFVTGQILGVDGGLSVAFSTPFPKGFDEAGSWLE